MFISREEATKIILDGGVVAIPTDTVYGLASLLENEAQLFALKERPEDKKILLLHASVESMEPELGQFARFWPGPLSVVYGERGHRVPDHPAALFLLEATGPLAVTSANKSGHRAATTPEEVEGMFGEEFPILDGVCKVGEASTIVALKEGRVELLRAGPVPFPLPPEKQTH